MSSNESLTQVEKNRTPSGVSAAAGCRCRPQGRMPGGKSAFEQQAESSGDQLGATPPQTSRVEAPDVDC